ncbi:inosine triphosphate pyrophosphatase, putative [Eimeria brunetti]|uniref:Inosine triphosphate pyrophosphatase, putative n=1 Tax=Eimeria brunetti TaxID=51314 RepID=U6LFD0_9EIME|nr:inosine triphosphate pyrophosphatase, putative [Eimeria brunetti]
MARAVVYFCTGNQNKLREVQQLMEGVPVEFRALDVDLPELQGETAEISKGKCQAALDKHRSSSSSSSSNSSSSNGSSSSSSSSSGLPEFVFTEDTALCFNALGGLPGPYVKWFLKNLGAPGLPKLLAGFEGSVVEPRGKTTFGWDCIFEERSSKKTFGEMTSEEKAAVSHRGRAMKQLKEFLLKATA